MRVQQAVFPFFAGSAVAHLGKIIGCKTVGLYEDVLMEDLGAEQTYLDYENPGEPEKDVVCPFCNSGRLMLRKVVFELTPTTQRNHYLFYCTFHPACSASFVGQHDWPRID